MNSLLQIHDSQMRLNYSLGVVDSLLVDWLDVLVDKLFDLGLEGEHIKLSGFCVVVYWESVSYFFESWVNPFTFLFFYFLLWLG